MPNAHAVQTECANYLEVLYSKHMVLNIQVKGSAKTESGECKEAERNRLKTGRISFFLPLQVSCRLQRVAAASLSASGL
jgi:hypothetical protein